MIQTNILVRLIGLGTSFILSWLLFNSEFNIEYIDLLYFAATPVFIDLGFGMSLQLSGIRTKFQKRLLLIGIVLSIMNLLLINEFSYNIWTKYLLVPILLCDYCVDRLSMNRLMIKFNIWRQSAVITGAILCCASLNLNFRWENILIAYMIPRIFVNIIILHYAKEMGFDRTNRYSFLLYYPGQVLFFINNQLIYFVMGLSNPRDQLLYGSSDRVANFFARPLTIFGQFYVNLSFKVKKYFRSMFVVIIVLIVSLGKILVKTIFPDLEVNTLVTLLQFFSIGFIIPSSNLLFSVYKLRNYMVLAAVTIVMLSIRLALLENILGIAICNLFLAFFTYIYTRYVAEKNQV